MSDMVEEYEQNSHKDSFTSLKEWILLIEAYMLFIIVDIGIHFFEFGKCIQFFLRPQTYNRDEVKDKRHIIHLVEIVKCASRFYFRQTKCFERSLVTCIFLRFHGIPANVCIASSIIPPLMFHAWVEYDGNVLNDSQTVKEEYTIVSIK